MSTLRTLRRNRSLTLRQLSKTTGVSVGFLSKLERQKIAPTESTLRKVASTLGVDPEPILREFGLVPLDAIGALRHDARLIELVRTVRDSPERIERALAVAS